MNIDNYNPETELINFESKMNYQIGKCPKIDEMVPTKSISDILINKENTKPLKGLLLGIFARYLSVNIKGRNISNEFGYKLMIDFILNDCKNLELQEVEYIFKNGVMGRFGQLYNDISVDTICGINGWIEMYYKEHRKNRMEGIKPVESFNFTGNEMTLKEFHESHPDYLERSNLLELFEKAKKSKCGVQDLKLFYKIKGYTVGEMQDDLSIIAGKYYSLQEKNAITEKQWVDNWINNFIKQNYNKKKYL